MTQDLDALEQREQREHEDIRGAAYKTVATFAGLTQRKLWLRDANTASTDGHEILAPFSHPFFYQIVEHELAHILFQSDGIAKAQFVTAYIASINATLRKAGIAEIGEHPSLRELLNTIVGVLEDIRCESLWALLYPGSFQLMQQLHETEVRKFLDRAHLSLSIYFIILSCGVEPTVGPFTRFRPLLADAMEKVKRRSFGSTLVVSKWLFQQLIDEILKDRWKVPQEDEHKGTGDGPLPGSSEDVAVRFEGVKALMAGDCPSVLSLKANDTLVPKYEKKEEAAKAARLVGFVMKFSTDPLAVEDYLQRSEEAMQGIVNSTREAIGKQLEVSDWITKDAFGKVRLHDVESSAQGPIGSRDRSTVEQLRSVFFRVMGRRKTVLEEDGCIVDVVSYISSKISGQPEPCFGQESKGRGFKALVLLDRSGSMRGLKTKQAERACRILVKALDFPFVDFNVWGFQSKVGSTLDLSRFDTEHGDFNLTDGEAVGGHTPLHLALRVGSRFMSMGTEYKHILCVTDGWPSHTTSKGYSLGTRALHAFVRDEVRHARRIGVNVTGVLIGNDVGNDKLSFMFGPPSNWRRMPQERFGDDLVKLVLSSFMRYLRYG